MAMDWLGSAIGASASHVNLGISTLATRKQNLQAQSFAKSERLASQEYQTSEREAQNQWNLEQWNRQNAYDSPSAQLQRAMEAGINPNSVVGNMNNGSTASSAGNAGAPGTPSYPQFDEGAAWREAAAVDANFALQMAQIKDLEGGAKLKEQQAEGQEIQNKVNEKWLDKTCQAQYNVLYTEAQNNMADTSLKEGEKEQIVYELKNLLPQTVRLTQNNADKAYFEIKQLAVEIANGIKTGKLIEQQERTSRAQQTAFQASATESGQRSYYYNRLGKQIDISNSILEGKAKIFKETGVDVDGNLVNMLVQLAMSEKGDKTLDKLLSNISKIADKIRQEGEDTGNIIVNGGKVPITDAPEMLAGIGDFLGRNSKYAVPYDIGRKFVLNPIWSKYKGLKSEYLGKGNR